MSYEYMYNVRTLLSVCMYMAMSHVEVCGDGKEESAVLLASWAEM